MTFVGIPQKHELGRQASDNTVHLHQTRADVRSSC